MHCTLDADGLSVDFEPRIGSFHPWWRGLRVTVHDAAGLRPAEAPLQDAGLREPPREVSVDIADPVGGAHVRFVRRPVAAPKPRL
jgi:hypothetical protein